MDWNYVLAVITNLIIYIEMLVIFNDLFRYAVGTTYDNEQCEQCTCTLNGISQCKDKECPPCREVN